MTISLFSVNVADVERDAQHRSWEIPVDWLESALADSEAQSTGQVGRFTASLLKNGSEYLVRGKIEVQVSLPCARTLEPAVYDLKPELFLMLVQKAAPGENKSRQSSRGRTQQEPETVLEDDDAARDVFTGDTIQLDPFVREQVLLELPMFPLRSDLREKQSPAIGAPPVGAPGVSAVDPRLAPLQALREKLTSSQEPGAPTADTPNKKKRS
jgi:uncharacterized protein